MKKYKFIDKNNNIIFINAKNINDAIKKLKIKDEATLSETINSLIEDEKAAIEAYDIVIKNYKGKLKDIAIETLEHIKNDEKTHIESLYSIINGNVNSLYLKLYNNKD